MPKKRNSIKSFKPYPAASTSSSSSPSGFGGDKAPRDVNQLLATLRDAGAGPSSSPSLSETLPSIPPSIREILQIPETPSPAPRRPCRQRYDSQGRRLPAGPAPPRSWLSGGRDDGDFSNSLARSLRVSYSGFDRCTLPGAPLPQPGSLIDLVLRRLAVDWDFHRVFNQYHLYFVPSHLKPALIRYIGVASNTGVSISDLKTILLPPEEVYSDEKFDHVSRANTEITCLDLSASVGRSLKLKDVTSILFNAVGSQTTDEPQESWETVDTNPSPPRLLLPNLTHLSLALDPRGTRDAPWKELLSLSSRLPAVTHLSLAYWPEPCLAPRAKFSTISSPQGRNISYGGTNYYSHSLDHDWTEALLVLRMLSNNFYRLEFLDLTGCATWFKALRLKDGHDYVDWSGSWGRLTVLRLYTGWELGMDAMASDKAAYKSAIDTAKRVEKHIVAMRAGKGRFITVERDSIDG
ncbi:tafazzin [Metarhizium album ARSEF 1941]|uniref:Tafazzin n=1 Tax=Metarhizium album (strain ARSEF 1941) TaxID=1081103 RepID=A0A0B2WYX0_METAS|nr:tafazzin [Metarhizium album ARSEF 1941]KHN98060.1 tafazzin [Metarhizium album ARSEF 1941]